MFGVTCQFSCKEPFPIDDESVASHLYRIAQEAINNGIKHGKPKNVTISLFTDGTTNTLSVADDGIGIGNVPGLGKGMGLNIMNYRASMIGASLEIRPGKAGGTVVSCSFPALDSAE
jgi:signal transduction histidine kinase